MELNHPVSSLKGVGSELSKKFRLIGIKTLHNLIYNFPKRYEDYSHVSKVNQLRPGQITIEAKISHAVGRWSKRGIHVTEAIANDETGSVRLIWFNQIHRAQSLKTNEQYYISGEYKLSHQRFSIINPSIELVSDFPVNTARIVPVYSLTKGLSSGSIRKALKQTLPLVKKIPDDLPVKIRDKHGLVSHSEAVQQLHFPEKIEKVEIAKRRLGFEEIFAMILASQLNKKENEQDSAIAIKFDARLAQKFVASLPFELTDAQRRVVWQIYLDIQKAVPANRLVEGDVGSGKTVVAVMAALMAIKQGYQAALMAPTEVLARQHAAVVHSMLEAMGYKDKVGLLVGSMTLKQKQNCRERIKSGKIGLIIGTHALIEDKVDMHRLGLVIIDEQHRFGVEQRKELQAKAKHAVHVITLSATPIPRSLALTLYGELNISLLDAVPRGRQQVETKIASATEREKIYQEITLELKKGRQAFVVCPKILHSEFGGRSAEQVYSELKDKTLARFRVGLLHGRLKSPEKDRIMSEFVAGRIDVLVATTVIEVGVDVPNASVMVIESPERFGLAQIHQLRGRVGRGEHKSSCYLMLEAGQQPSRRLKAIEQYSDGFKLAELDLSLRGPGAIYGKYQHGELDLRFADLEDIRTIKNARDEALKFLKSGESLLKYPRLKQKVDALRKVTNLN